MNKAVVKIIDEHIAVSINESNKNIPLSELGLDSLSTIDLILELESELDIEFPDDLLVEESFSSAVILCEIIDGILR